MFKKPAIASKSLINRFDFCNAFLIQGRSDLYRSPPDIAHLSFSDGGFFI
jgi:hypothetical protein